MGVKEKSAERDEAMRFLRSKTSGQKVFLRFGSAQYDAQNTLLCYVYLQNRTFLNAHLIKRGLVDVDASVESKFRATT